MSGMIILRKRDISPPHYLEITKLVFTLEKLTAKLLVQLVETHTNHTYTHTQTHSHKHAHLNISEA